MAKDYAAIAAKSITHPSSSDRPPRILAYSRNKKGKSRFCATAPNVLILDPEDGSDSLTKVDPAVWKTTEWQDLDDVYHYLKSGKHPYEWVAIDGLTKISNISLRWVMGQEEERDLSRKPGRVTTPDYGKSGEMIKGMMNNFNSLPMGVIYTAQERVLPITQDSDEDDPDAETTEVMFVPDLPKGVRGAVTSLVDVIGRIYTVRLDHPNDPEKKVIQRRMWVEPHVSYDTGYRSEYVLPPFFKGPTVPKLCQLLKEGKVSGRS